MKYFITKIEIKRLDDTSAHWHKLKMVPATGVLEISTKKTEDGLLKTYSLKAVLSKMHDHISDNLQIKVFSVNNAPIVLGTKDIPVVFETKVDNLNNISAEYEMKG